VIKKHVRHPYRATMKAKTGGPAIAATLLPALKIPVAKARSFFGNHSATDLMAAGKLPLSPKPSIARQKLSPSAEPASACSAAAADHHTTDTAYPTRVPKRSMNFPT